MGNLQLRAPLVSHPEIYIRADLIFFRDELAAIYVDQMVSCLRQASACEMVIEIHVLPLVSIDDSLLSSWWQIFNHLNTLTTEAVWTFKKGILLPTDAPECDINPKLVMEFKHLYPITP